MRPVGWSSASSRRPETRRLDARGTRRDPIRETVDAVYRADSRRVLATLIRLLGDFDLAEEALHDAFAAALEQWPRDGVPANPRAWLVSTGRFKAIDAMRRRARFDASLGELAARARSARPPHVAEPRTTVVDDDRLRLIFTCCHPGAAAGRAGRADAARGLRPDDRGDRPRVPHGRRRRWPSGSSAPRRRFATRAFPIRCRRAPDLPDRLDAVLHVIYLVFNEGYSASSGDIADAARSVRRSDPARPTAGRAAAGAGSDGLLALMLLHESRRAAARHRRRAS